MRGVFADNQSLGDVLPAPVTIADFGGRGSSAPIGLITAEHQVRAP